MNAVAFIVLLVVVPLAVLLFLWRKDYEALDDPEFAHAARRVRTVGICYTILFAAILGWNLIAPAFRTR